MFLNRKSSFYDSEDRIVIDFGSAYTKFGLAGEATPRGIIRTVEPLNVVKNIINTVLVSDEKRKEVIMIENEYLTLENKTELSRLLLDYFMAISWIPSSFSASIAVGKPNVLMIDIGHEMTRVAPVFDRVPLLSLSTFTVCGSKAIQLYFVELLCTHGRFIKSGEEIAIHKDDLPLSLVEQLVSQVLHGSLVVDCRIRFNGNTEIHIPAFVRTEALHALFQGTPDCKSVQATVLDCLLKVKNVHLVSY
jgi:actin-related protein 10